MHRITTKLKSDNILFRLTCIVIKSEERHLLSFYLSYNFFKIDHQI